MSVQQGGINLSYLLGYTLLGGSLLSGAFSPDSLWINWHFSRLGEGQTLSSVIFNSCLFISGVIMTLIAFSIKKSLIDISRGSSEYAKASKLFFALLISIAICLMLLALLPFDKFSILHNIAGYSLLAFSIALALSTNFVLPVFARKYKFMPIIIVSTAIVLYVPYFIAHNLSLLMIEFVLFVLIYIWFIMFTNSILKHNKNKHR